MSATPEILQLKIYLLGISPMIWRRVLVPSSTTLRELHGVFQVVMGWEGIHLYQFEIYAVNYSSPYLSGSDPNIPLSDFKLRQNARFSYTYDMTDYWKHEVRVEGFQTVIPKRKYPVCIGGSKRCPPEECGGVHGFRIRKEGSIPYRGEMTP